MVKINNDQRVEGDVILGAYGSHRERDMALENYHLWQMGRKNT
ncbi:hypothetical protein [Nocardiopsis metallicus]|uniref:Uncharacterized protein n=1 Tax=Nocardiopsis metallicus TaxID=179819 RepID=A0A840W398_9ACTN|nr:hypothetical protein [Nocardiopsis metallicus]MBB5491360.1 hypothetical protein [Nocardiopsis metallicus]